VEPLITAVGLGSFGIYSTWAAWAGANFEWGPYLSPFYSPFFQFDWWTLSPAFLILWIPLGFRTTCYYYRKAYYRAFFLDPAACAVGEARHDYQGENRLFLFQNLHRFFLYLAIIILVVLGYDAIKAMIWPVAGVGANGEMPAGPRELGIGIGTLVMTLNVILLAGYTFGCHSLRHIVGGSVDCYSCATLGKLRHRAWERVSFLNRHHMGWAWVSLIWVALTDLYIRLCAMGVINDVRLF
jgi:hypothetical protein